MVKTSASQSEFYSPLGGMFLGGDPLICDQVTLIFTLTLTL